MDRAVAALIQVHPTFGIGGCGCCCAARTRLPRESQSGLSGVETEGWFVHQRVATPPRVRGWVSQASPNNERWAMDVTHIPCGPDGWAHLAAVIDCHDREDGYEFALRVGPRSRARGGSRLPGPVWDAPATVGAPVLQER